MMTFSLGRERSGLALVTRGADNYGILNEGAYIIFGVLDKGSKYTL